MFSIKALFNTELRSFDFKLKFQNDLSHKS